MESRTRARGGNTALKITLIVLIVLLVAALAAIAYFYIDAEGAQWLLASGENEPTEDEFLETATFAPGIVVDGIDIAGLTFDEAFDLLDAKLSEHLPADSVTVRLDDATAEVSLAEAFVQSNFSEVLEQALAYGNNGTRKEREEEREKLALEGITLGTQVELILDDIMPEVEEAAAMLSTQPVDATAEVDLDSPEKFTFTESAPGKVVDAQALYDLIAMSIMNENTGAPIDAPFELIEPAVTTEMVQANNTLVSTYTTSFKKGSLGSSNRSFNIKKAAGLINGTVLQPGEEFDTNAALGPRTYETGWKGANGIRAGRYETEAGGGVCQVSTTLFNAVVMADLEVTDRKPHSWPLSYVDPGRDATISTGGPNFKFRNNRETPMIVVAYTNDDKKTITVELYGEPLPDGMRIELSVKRTGSLDKYKTEYVLVNSMKAGSSEVYREGRTGSTHETYKSYYKGDELIKTELAFRTTYRTINEIINHGPALPDPTPTPVVEQPPVEPNPSPTKDPYLPW